MAVEGEEEALLSEPSPSFPSASRITPFTVLLVLTGAIGGFLFGYDTGVVSGALFYLRDDPILAGLPAGSEDLVEGAIVAGTTVGAALGAGLGSVASDRLGRRQSILYADAFFLMPVLRRLGWDTPEALQQEASSDAPNYKHHNKPKQQS